MQYNQRFGLRMYNQTSVVQGEAQLSNVVVTSSAQALRGRIGVATVGGVGSIAAIAISVIVGIGAAGNVVTVLSSAMARRSTEAYVNLAVNANGYTIRKRNGFVLVTCAGNVSVVPFRIVGGSSQVLGLLQSDGYAVRQRDGVLSATGVVTANVLPFRLSGGIAQVIGVTQSDGYAVRKRNGMATVFTMGNIAATPFRLVNGTALLLADVHTEGLGKIIHISKSEVFGSGSAFGNSVVRVEGLADVEAVAQSLSGSVTKLSGHATPQMAATSDAYAVYIVVDQAVVNALTGGMADSFVFRWIPSQFVQKTWNEFLNGADIWRPVLLPGAQWKQKII